ncbi:internalin A [Streptomyces aurantiacus]|uniref:leucine-rich repeat domain-containing protein n=1 Tax=Streptomyces aurantiacus TaxID=47760 RepID=UPI002792A1E7|nr:leucine-rich repeat domain-containing protein [Streptomyces aurantiacus]MDQ0779751.1 internalin A [Streptomyces aurantiacus]
MTTNDDDSGADTSRLDELRHMLATGKQVTVHRAMGELVEITDDGTALAVAARFADTTGFPSRALLRMWPQASDPDGFSAALLAPALARENQTSIRLRGKTSLTGLRHLTTLQGLHLDRCKEITDLTEVGELTGLTDLDLNGCAGIEDLTPIGRLTELTRLNLHRCRAVQDTTPLLTLGKLRELDLSITRVRSVDGFGTAFPALETLTLRGCRSFRDAAHLSGLTRLTHLNLGWTGIRDLTGLRNVPAVTHLDLRSCSRLRDLTGSDAMSALTELILQDCPRLETVRGLGSHPRLTRLEIKGCPELADVSALSALTGLTRLIAEGTERLTSLRGLETLGSLESLWLADCPALEDFSALTQLSALDELGLQGLGQLRDLTPFAAVPGLASLHVIDCDGLVTLEGLEHQDHLADLVVYQCRSVRRPGRLGDLPALARVRMHACPSLTGFDGLGDLPVLRELHVAYCELLVDPGGLAGAPVEDVVFARMPNLGSLHALEACPDLRRLELIECPAVEDIPVGPVTELHLDGLEWRDLSLLAGHKNLRHLWLGLHKLEDISALLAVPDLIALDLGLCPSLKDKNLGPLLDLPSLERVTLPYGLHPGGFPARYASLVARSPRGGLPQPARSAPSPEWSAAWCTTCSGFHLGGSALRLHCPAAA